MYLRIPYSVARQLANDAKHHAPSEVCGLLVGEGDTIQYAIEIENIANTPQSQYKLNPTQYLKALKQIESDELEWLGVFHSHPSTAPIPSETDISETSDSNLIHIIISLAKAKPQLKAWRISTDKSVQPVELLFDTQKRPEHEMLSNSQKIAIILSGILSVLILLAISFTLLPPAPQITPMP